MVIIPRQNDVLFGKGTAINSHHGNIQLRQLVESRKAIFVATKRSEKRNVAKDMINDIKCAGGRFLMEDPKPATDPTGGSNSTTTNSTTTNTNTADNNNNDGGNNDDEVTDPFILDKVWVHVDDMRAIEKVMHRLREKKTYVSSSYGSNHQQKQPQQQPPQQQQKQKQQPNNENQEKSSSDATKKPPSKQRVDNHLATIVPLAQVGKKSSCTLQENDTKASQNFPLTHQQQQQVVAPQPVAQQQAVAQVAFPTWNIEMSTKPENEKSAGGSYKTIKEQLKRAEPNHSSQSSTQGISQSSSSSILQDYLKVESDLLQNAKSAGGGSYRTIKEPLKRAESNHSSQSSTQGHSQSSSSSILRDYLKAESDLLQNSNRTIKESLKKESNHNSQSSTQSHPPSSILQGYSKVESDLLQNVKSAGGGSYKTIEEQLNRPESNRSSQSSNNQSHSQSNSSSSILRANLKVELKREPNHSSQSSNNQSHSQSSSSSILQDYLKVELDLLQNAKSAGGGSYKTIKESLKRESNHNSQSSTQSLSPSSILQGYLKVESDLLQQYESQKMMASSQTMKTSRPTSAMDNYGITRVVPPIPMNVQSTVASAASSAAASSVLANSNYNIPITMATPTSFNNIPTTLTNISLPHTQVTQGQAPPLPASIAINNNQMPTLPSNNSFIHQHQTHNNGQLQQLDQQEQLGIHPVSIQYWISVALATPLSPDDYLKGAVELARLLTEKLMQLIAAAKITLPDISVQNIILLVTPRLQPMGGRNSNSISNSGHSSSSSSNSNGLATRSVQFRQEALAQLSMSQRAQCGSLPLSSRAVCAALGNILLELFSKGRSSTLGISGNCGNTQSNIFPPSGGGGGSGGSGILSYRVQGDDAFMLPAKKRMASSMPSVSTTNLGSNHCGSGSTSSMAMVHNLLMEVGMPMSIRSLVCDLLDATSELCPDSALTSLEETMWDLNRMERDPQHFLFDRMCPRRALDDTCLFHSVCRHMFGREKELGILMNAKRNVANHIRPNLVVQPSNTNGKNDNGDGDAPCSPENNTVGDNNYLNGHGSSSSSNVSFGQDIDFRCEAIFLSGYAGSGKSRVVQSLTQACSGDGWFVLTCKFDEQAAPIKALIQGFDDFFGKWKSGGGGGDGSTNHDSDMMESFCQVCRSLLSTIDKEGLNQLRELIPNMGKILPQVATSETKGHIVNDQGSSSIDKVGSATKRRMHLFHVLFKSLCSAGRPVLIVHDDIHWSDSGEGLKDFITNYVNIPCALQKGARHHGLMIVGTFRSNEVNDEVIENVNSIEKSESAHVTKVAIEELAQTDIGKLLSATLCLPLRYTQELADLVHTKTRGNPFFIIQFLKTIIQNRMLQYSVSHRRWMWDCDVIDMQMISDGVAELLTTRFNQLPLHLMKTVIIASCFGSQVEDSTIDLLKPFNMQGALQLAIREGIMEKAGPIYQFTHDLIRQTIYESVPVNERKAFHKTIGMILLASAADDSATHLLAVEQINFYCQDVSILCPEECAQFACINATAAKFAIAASSFEQARSYIDTGMRLLKPNHWDEQYSLSLELHEMSASISCINGDIGDMSSCLHEIIAHVKSFEDSLTASSLLSKLLAASSKYDEAMSNCLSILSALGEEFPEDITLPHVLNELSVIQTTLANISVDQVKRLSPMKDKPKLNAMKFLSMLCSYSIQAKPMLVPILSCRMVRITIEYGFCDDSIVGLVTAGFSLFSFTDDIQLGYRIGKVGESFIEESPNRHALWSRLCFELDGNLKAMVEPMQSAVGNCPDRYNSAMLTGDIDSAMMSLLAHCIGSLHIGTELTSLSKLFVACIKQSTKYQQETVLYLAMSAFGACIFLSGGNGIGEVEVKSYQELNQIGERKKHLHLLYQNFFNEMYCYFWVGDYMKVFELSKKHKPTGHKRILEVTRTFFEGIASLALARRTHQPNWRRIGEEALGKMIKLEKISSWNFDQHVKLLQAEIHYLNGDMDSAEVAYKASIVSAREHKFTHYVALASELYGRFCVQNLMAEKGAAQLQVAIDEYKQWGAMKKVSDVKAFMDTVNPSSIPRRLSGKI